MPLIARVGRKAFGPRVAFAFLYAVLTVGGVTMVYPFLVMVATSITSRVDYDQFKVFPAYLYRDDWLFAKYLEDRYQVLNPRQNSLALNPYHRANYSTSKDPLYVGITRLFEAPLAEALRDDARGALPGDATLEAALGPGARRILDGTPEEILGTADPETLRGDFGLFLDRDRVRHAGGKKIRELLTEAWSKALQKPAGQARVRLFLDFALRKEYPDADLARLRRIRVRDLLPPDFLRLLEAKGVRGPWTEARAFSERTLGDLVADRWFEPDGLDKPANRRRVEDFEEFLRGFRGEKDLWMIAFPDYRADIEVVGRSSRLFQAFLLTWLPAHGHPATLEGYNDAFHEDRESFHSIQIPIESPLQRGWVGTDPLYKAFEEFKWTSLPPDFLVPVSPDADYQAFLKSSPSFQGKIEALNRRWSTGYRSFSEIPLPGRMPEGDAGAAWLDYVRNKISFRLLELEPLEAPFRRFAAEQFRARGDLAGWRKEIRRQVPDLPPGWEDAPKTWDDVRIPVVDGQPRGSLWDAFLLQAPPEALLLRTPEGRFRDFLTSRHGDIGRLNEAWGSAYRGFGDVHPPYALWDRQLFERQKGSLRGIYLTRNYREVFDYIFLHGRALLNTAVLVVCSIAVHLVVNPLCAFALSRYQLSYTNKILLFCLATMAFPHEISLIPNFLFLKETGLLNTFGALILPHVAHGYSIFLLKGFFDSLPKELYESAAIEGAGEFRMFWQITAPLSKPILAVIALSSFQQAYGSFLWALVVCPKQEMWTLMVWLYDMNGWAPYSTFVAALCVAAIPTLLLFVFCQKIIMRGIVLPLAH